MESLAYTILELQIRCLPWSHCVSHEDLLARKKGWTGERWTATAGDPTGYGYFLDAVRDRGQVLDYARWKRELCGDSTPIPSGPGGAETPFKYDPLDVDPPIHWRSAYDWDSEAHMPLTAAELVHTQNSFMGWSSVPGSAHGFNPRSTWSGPMAVEDAATFGDELELVLSGLALIDRRPTCRKTLHVWQEPEEEMRRFSDICGENVSSVVGGDWDNGNGDGRSGSDPVNGGYSDSEGESEGSGEYSVDVTEDSQEASGESSDSDDSSDFRARY
ncbi:hypothetical protein GSI_02123 [Ganoderma sinense ZZ0214-1]|uniref:Uncharacterized protein n=1 Tax=Ganoderma sinense ZZ0214-1 TaxID=1077348 RepID=A0A2G8SNP8_9APHY|nr:hypothetical protein GSI_02123 [Ganoderma sinense ZZ0214-1]